MYKVQLLRRFHCFLQMNLLKVQRLHVICLNYHRLISRGRLQFNLLTSFRQRDLGLSKHAYLGVVKMQSRPRSLHMFQVFRVICDLVKIVITIRNIISLCLFHLPDHKMLSMLLDILIRIILLQRELIYIFICKYNSFKVVI